MNATGLAGAGAGLLLGACLWGLLRLWVVTGVLVDRGELVTSTPLGVAVPTGRLDDRRVLDVVLDAARRYRRLLDTGMVAVLVVVVAAGLAWPAAALALGALGPLAVGVGAYVTARREIVSAKAAQAWFAGEPQARRATVSAREAPPRRAHVSAWPYACALAFLGLVAAYGASLVDRLPATIPTHWGADGRPDAFAGKGLWSVFGVLIVAAGIAVACFVLARVTVAQASGRGDATRSERETHVVQRTLGAVALACAVGLGALTVVSWRRTLDAGVEATLPAWWSLLVVAPVVLVTGLSITAARRTRLADRDERAAHGDRRGQTDDDPHWKWGLVYADADDPSTFVPKRTGIGLTVNVASTGGRIFLGALAALAVLALAGPAIGSLIAGG